MGDKLRPRSGDLNPDLEYLDIFRWEFLSRNPAAEYLWGDQNR